MNRNFFLGLTIVIAAVLFSGGIYLDVQKDVLTSSQRKLHQFQKVLNKKEAKLTIALDKLENLILLEGRNVDNFQKESIFKSLRKDGIEILFYQKDTLSFWTDKSIQVANLYSESKLTRSLAFLGNGWYRIINRELGDGNYLSGLILLKHQYVYENRFLHNTFQNKFHLPTCVDIHPNPDEAGEAVFDLEGEYLFSLIFHPEENCLSSEFTLSAYFYLAGIIFLLVLLRVFVKRIKSRVNPNYLVVFLALFLSLANYLIFHFRFPAALFEIEMFSPYYFAVSAFLSSLGQLFLISAFIFLLFYVFYKDFNVERFIRVKGKYAYISNYIAGMILASLFFSIIVYLFKNLILNSNLSFEPYKILDINYLGIVGYFSVVLLFISFGLFLYKLISSIKIRKTLNLFIIPLGITLPVLLIIRLFLIPQLDIYSIAFFVIFSLVIYKLTPGFPYITIVIFSLLFGIYSSYIIVDISEKKEKDERKVIAVNLSTERDPVAELLLEEMGPRISENASLKSLMNVDLFTDEDIDEIFNYLDTRFFDGYWEKFDLTITLCNSGSSLLVDEKTETSCFSFFEDLTENSNNMVGLSDFCFIDNQSGGNNYLGSFFFPKENDTLMNGLFISLDSKQIYQQLGYPELLIDNSVFKPARMDDFSYAKYKNGELIFQSGEYKYSLSDKNLQDKKEETEFSVKNIGGYNHLVYNTEKDILVVVSQEETDAMNLLISFSYLFGFLFVISNLVFLISNVHFLKVQRSPLLKHKIQLWMIAVVFFSLIFIGSGAIYFSISQYKINQLRSLSEKVQSVYVELDHKIGHEQELASDWSTSQYANLDELLIKFSNVFFSDINLYDASGNLLAASRPEVFEKGLSGFKMDYNAYHELVVNQQAEFVQIETIGEQRFLSAYVPFRNHENHLLAYLNLPYFTKQSAITREVSNLVVGIINFSMVILLISTLLAIIISTQITNPLSLIQEKIREVRLGRRNEHIYYQGKDEIGRLVAEYNRMIDELAESANSLAKSERESAWREMARQIAHEIKNPLTPMKLNVQHLLRSWNDKSPDWGAQLTKISQTLIEQIDHLSSIATAFSNFAEMPRSKTVEINIVQVIEKVVSLFSNNEDFSIEVNLYGQDEAIILADENQLIRVFNNLLKNATQSLPDNKEGLIKIGLRKDSGKIVICIEDNGVGIPDDLGDKLFEPNFTTKTSGTGLGLAITKKIINDANGAIWYKSSPDGGATFIIEFPEYI